MTVNQRGQRKRGERERERVGKSKRNKKHASCPEEATLLVSVCVVHIVLVIIRYIRIT